MSTILLALLAQSSPALACGGFFCTPEEPVDQSGEKIVFAIDAEKGQVEVHVQIAYEGTAEDFAWVLPSPTLPEPFLSAETLFSTLEWSTEPQYRLTWTEEGDCAQDFRIRAGGDTACWNCDYADAVGVAEDSGGVTVVATQRVGPYETITLQASSSDELLTWLQDREFSLPESLAPALQPYLDADGYLIALRLAKDADTGDLAPFGMRYAGDTPMIPIQLTRIAATPDMRLQPYVFSTGRAVPDNYLHVVVNDAAIDWFSGGANYRDVITRAANEAGGQAFATDYAGSTDALADLMYTDGQWDGLTDSLAGVSTLQGFMDLLGGAGFGGTSQLLEVLTDCITMPPSLESQGVTPQDIFNCPGCFDEDLQFDPATCATQLDTRMLQPIIEADTLFDRFPWVTRLTSSISPAEMTSDPRFVINPGMKEVSQVHEAELVFECDGGAAYEAPRRLELADGTTIPLPSSKWFDDNGTTYLDWVQDAASYAAQRIEETSADEDPMTITDNTDAIAAALGKLADEDVPVGGGDPAPAGCGCRHGHGSTLWVALAGLALLRRRRR